MGSDVSSASTPVWTSLGPANRRQDEAGRVALVGILGLRDGLVCAEVVPDARAVLPALVRSGEMNCRKGIIIYMNSVPHSTSAVRSGTTRSPAPGPQRSTELGSPRSTEPERRGERDEDQPGHNEIRTIPPPPPRPPDGDTAVLRLSRRAGDAAVARTARQQERERRAVHRTRRRGSSASLRPCR